MTAEEYFGDWIRVIDKEELFKIMRWLKTVNPNNLCPEPRNIFKAFRVCPYNDCKVVILGMDPYPQKGVAQGILFANSADTTEEQLSLSLRVIKEAIINYEILHNVIEFDNTLESVAKQGVLLINSALTCEVGKTGIHFNIWRPFMSKLLRNMSEINSGIVYVLLGNQAQSFKDCIVGKQHIIMDYHPAYYARRGEKMPYTTFSDINKILKGMYGKGIEFYKETDYGICQQKIGT